MKMSFELLTDHSSLDILSVKYDDADNDEITNHFVKKLLKTPKFCLNGMFYI